MIRRALRRERPPATAVSEFLRDLAAREQNGAPRAVAGKEAYQAARVTRTTKHFQPDNISENAAIAESWPMLIARVRSLRRNSPSVKQAVRMIVDLVVGTGIQACPTIALEFIRASGPERDQMLDYSYESDLIFTEWAIDEADVEGKLTWWDIQRIALSELVETGDALLLECWDDSPGRKIGLCYQMLEREQLDASKDRPASMGQNRIVNGIELDARNRPVHYWIYDAHPYDHSAAFSGLITSSSPVPANRIRHLFLPFRPVQSIGLSWLHALVKCTRDLDWYLDNELTSAAIGALFTAIHSSDRHDGNLGMGDDTDDEDQDGNAPVKLGQGFIYDGGPNDDFKIAESKRPNRDAAPFLDVITLQQAMAAGLSPHRFTGDYSQTSYSSARAAHLDDDKRILPLQQWFGYRLVLPARRRVNAIAAARGRFAAVTPREFARDEDRLQRFDVTGTGREQLNPDKEQSAAAARVRAGMSTLAIENARRGLNWLRTAIQRAVEIVTYDHLGIVADLSSGGAQTGALAPATVDAVDDDEAEED